jgi:hypothetical protein
MAADLPRPDVDEVLDAPDFVDRRERFGARRSATIPGSRTSSRPSPSSMTRSSGSR